MPRPRGGRAPPRAADPRHARPAHRPARPRGPAERGHRGPASGPRRDRREAAGTAGGVGAQARGRAGRALPARDGPQAHRRGRREAPDRRRPALARTGGLRLLRYVALRGPRRRGRPGEPRRWPRSSPPARGRGRGARGDRGRGGRDLPRPPLAVQGGAERPDPGRGPPSSGLPVRSEPVAPRREAPLLGARRVCRAAGPAPTPCLCPHDPKPRARRASRVPPPRGVRVAEPGAPGPGPVVPLREVPLPRDGSGVPARRRGPRGPRYGAGRPRPRSDRSASGVVTGGAHADPKQTSARVVVPFSEGGAGNENGGGGRDAKTNAFGW